VRLAIVVDRAALRSYSHLVRRLSARRVATSALLSAGRRRTLSVNPLPPS
jgi:hypothetical protein